MARSPITAFLFVLINKWQKYYKKILPCTFALDKPQHIACEDVMRRHPDVHVRACVPYGEHVFRERVTISQTGLKTDLRARRDCVTPPPQSQSLNPSNLRADVIFERPATRSCWCAGRFDTHPSFSIIRSADSCPRSSACVFVYSHLNALFCTADSRITTSKWIHAWLILNLPYNKTKRDTPLEITWDSWWILVSSINASRVSRGSRWQFWEHGLVVVIGSC